MDSKKQNKKRAHDTMASQNHGFMLEEEIKEKVYGITKDKKIAYTEVHDIPAELNAGVPVSIKTTGSNTICFGDALRMFKNSNLLNYECILVKYKQMEEEKQIEQIIHLDLAQSKKALFGEIEYDEIQELDSLVKSIPAGKCNTELYNKFHTLKKQLNKKSGYIRFNPKVDSKNQRRLQCSMPKFPEFVEKEKERMLEQSFKGVLRGIQLSMSVLSKRRIRLSPN